MEKILVKKVVRELIEKQFANFDPEDELLRQLDSLQLMNMVTEVEREFKISIPGILLTHDNLRSIDSLVDLIEDRQKA